MQDTHETKFLVFSRTKQQNKKTYDVEVHNKHGELLAKMYWRTGWRTYVVNVQPDIDLDIKCWDDIGAYIRLLLEERLIQLASEIKKENKGVL